MVSCSRVVLPGIWEWSEEGDPKVGLDDILGQLQLCEGVEMFEGVG